MANTILTSGVRNNLLTLQQTTAEQGAIQNRLATGRRVNSAIDNPINFFTAAGLNDRSNQLGGLLDGISNGIQTIQTASKGIDAIVKLVQSAQSTIKQAQADAAQNRPSTTGAAIAATKAAALAKDVAAAGNIVITAGNTEYTVAIGATETIRDVVNKINDSGIATATVNNSGELTIKGTGSDALTIAGADAVTGAAGSDAAAVVAAGNSDIRANLVDQFNELRSQINELAKDAGFNGINLLAGDALSVVFNEKTGAAQNKLDIQGEEISATNLGIAQAGSAVGDIDFQNDNALANASDALTNALTSLRSSASSLGSQLSVIQTRQDFTKNMINTLTIGADNLVLADSNEEGAKLLALNTRQQLSQTALSLASQADQGVLRLFG
ncbi:flagellin-like hook-associated protein FlgL [Bosea sp. AK1]|uniref:flagellin N-terminal helical domain-containing protein n=1 Tax=Bosea sp. AK1 TaxID=2587160 RepID=UPI00114ECA56|nr:flagellin [Bosea sp. AK1]TQI72994.1 flagellin-like hook-associated protein FlgL [Bosea sp. AK1]